MLELRFGSDRNAEVGRAAATDVGDRVEVLPDRILIYSSDGDAELSRIAALGLRAADQPGAPLQPGGRVPAAHRTEPDRMTATVTAAFAGGVKPRRYGSWYVAEHRIRSMRAYAQTVVFTSVGNPVVLSVRARGRARRA